MSATAPQRLDAAAAPLGELALIEANAGTGKTWTIGALYLRLLLEGRHPVERILVVTFTEAATGELRDRIRTRLADARERVVRGDAGDDAVAAALIERVPRDEALLRLTAAIRDFDQAPIYTIHAFCQRALGDQAFDTGVPFRTDIVVDQSALLQEIVEDFWRIELAAASPLYTRFLVSRRIEPGKLRDLVDGHLGKPYVTVLAPRDENAAALEAAFEAAVSRARDIWNAERERIAALLTESKSLHAGRYKTAAIPVWLDEMHGCLGAAAAGLDLCDSFDKFTTESLEKAAKGGQPPPRHAFFDACQAVKDAKAALAPAYENRLRALQARLIGYCDAELASRKERHRLQSYDDLLLNLDAALRGERGEALARALRERYSAALIDEFQDTDPIQYAIFRRIYDGSSQPVFLVGDPKQSIYSFRGADVFTYLEARAAAARQYTLDVNWRSDPALLDAVNALFRRSPAPFLIGDIPFAPSSAAPGSRGAFLASGDEGAALQIWHAESAGKPIGKDDARDAAARATAGKIAGLLAAKSGARIVEPSGVARDLRGGDIAVLVRNHRQARKVRDALSALGVASVQRGSANVFASREAEELERVLLAVAEPGRESLVAAALTTEMIGLTGDALYAARADEAQWERAIERFRDAHREWHEHGFIRMLRGLLQTYGCVARLLGYADGERRVTNLMHLAELAHVDAAELGTSGLVAWLATKRREANPAIEAELLRLESDENLVKILTIHVAKGLEFPLVFCPYLWDVNLWADDDQLVRYHDPAQGHRSFLDVAPERAAASREQARREELAENLRLLYVALTRAKYRCWIVWGHIKDAECAALAWLLHGPRDRESAQALDAFSSGIVALAPSKMSADLERLVAESEGRIGVKPLPLAQEDAVGLARPPARDLAARAFTAALRDARRTTSFTALAHGRSIEAPDYDAADRDPLPESVSGRDIFAFPRGAQAGKCIHTIFEHADFTRRDRSALERIVGKALAAHGFDATWTRALADMVEAVVDTPLDASGMRLSNVARERRLDELEFYYPLASVTDAGLREVLRGGGFPEEIRERIGALSFVPTRGYMTGFIDLVFEHAGRYYLADYKSNWLGATVAAYGERDLARAMGREAYYLQYLIYCVALHRYLRARVAGYRYAIHFGGVRYLFIRGMRPASGAAYGVYSDAPSEGLIEALDRYLAEGNAR